MEPGPRLELWSRVLGRFFAWVWAAIVLLLASGYGMIFGVYAGFDDPRVRAILVLYLAERSGGSLKPGDDAIEARFFSVRRLPRDIAFQAHREALREFAARVAAGRRDDSATPPKRARAAPPRSRRA